MSSTHTKQQQETSVANDMGSIEGSVEAFGGMGADLGNIEASMSSSHGGGLSDTPQVGGLDLDPNSIGQPIAVMDSRINDPAPAFVANVTNADAKAIGMSVMLGSAATAAILSTGPTAGPLAGAAIISTSSAFEAFAHAAADAQQSMGIVGAFNTTSVSNSDTSGYGAAGSVDPNFQWNYGSAIDVGGG